MCHISERTYALPGATPFEYHYTVDTLMVYGSLFIWPDSAAAGCDPADCLPSIVAQIQ